MALLVVVGCGTATPTSTQQPPAPSPTTSAPSTTAVAPVAEGCADVVAAEARRAADGTWTFSATVASADTGWDKYADAWEVRSLDGAVLGTRELLHPHVDEQPFTRTLTGVEVPEGTTQVTIAARDSVAGWCGKELTIKLGDPDA